ncbi:hypothetical protein CHARACLAT_007221 [Characodon lateralis]|uniref:Uncharacterized protein n=1 Tax=Characodon lateralis TaxID=208331 RepID=A0ABU7EH25_9TELE|nr:hypothetical protein [Characodon lateralis]
MMQQKHPLGTHLRDQFLLGQEDDAILQMLKRVLRLDPDATFSAVQQEALLLEGEQSPRWPEVTCAAVRDPNVVRSHQQSDVWKQELRKELMEEVKAQMTDLAQPEVPVGVAGGFFPLPEDSCCHGGLVQGIRLASSATRGHDSGKKRGGNLGTSSNGTSRERLLQPGGNLGGAQYCLSGPHPCCHQKR